MIFQSLMLSDAAIKAEIFFLGGRYKGEALVGAKLELAEARVTFKRRRLLHAVIRRLTSKNGAAV